MKLNQGVLMETGQRHGRSYFEAEEKLKQFYHFINIVKKVSTMCGFEPDVNQILKTFRESYHD